jgi:hypothetical protein
MLSLETLAGSTGTHEVPDVSAHLRKVEVTPEAMERALDSLVAIIMHGSKELQ